MSNFAKIDKNGVVVDIIAAEQDFINSGQVGDSFEWVQTSYNHNFRKHYAMLGGTYDKVNDVFVMHQPFPSYTLDSNHDWQPPIEKPDDGKDYRWIETRYQADNSTGWEEVTEDGTHDTSN